MSGVLIIGGLDERSPADRRRRIHGHAASSSHRTSRPRSLTQAGTAGRSSPRRRPAGHQTPGFPSADAGNQDDTAQMPQPGPPKAGDAHIASQTRTAARTPKRPVQPCHNIPRLQTLNDPGAPHRGRSGRSDQTQQCINIRFAACLPSGSRDCQRCEEFLITARQPAVLYRSPPVRDHDSEWPKKNVRRVL
jgi:hypothetical protein